MFNRLIIVKKKIKLKRFVLELLKKTRRTLIKKNILRYLKFDTKQTLKGCLLCTSGVRLDNQVVV